MDKGRCTKLVLSDRKRIAAFFAMSVSEGIDSNGLSK
jgi:hypothetical protein